MMQKLSTRNQAIDKDFLGEGRRTDEVQLNSNLLPFYQQQTNTATVSTIRSQDGQLVSIGNDQYSSNYAKQNSQQPRIKRNLELQRDLSNDNKASYNINKNSVNIQIQQNTQSVYDPLRMSQPVLETGLPIQGTQAQNNAQTSERQHSRGGGNRYSKLQTLKNKALRIILKEGETAEEEIDEEDNQDLERLIKEIDMHTTTFLTHANYLNTSVSKLPGVQNFNVKLENSYQDDNTIIESMTNMQQIQQSIENLSNFIKFDIKDIKQLQIFLQNFKNNLKMRRRRVIEKKKLRLKKDYIDTAPKRQEYISDNTNFFVQRKNLSSQRTKTRRNEGSRVLQNVNSTHLNEHYSSSLINQDFFKVDQNKSSQQQKQMQTSHTAGQQTQQQMNFKPPDSLTSIQNQYIYKDERLRFKLKEGTEKLASVMDQFINDTSHNSNKRAYTPSSFDSKRSSTFRKYLQSKVINSKMYQPYVKNQSNYQPYSSIKTGGVYNPAPDQSTFIGKLKSKYSLINPNGQVQSSNRSGQIQYKIYEDVEKSAKYYLNTDMYLNDHTINNSFYSNNNKDGNSINPVNVNNQQQNQLDTSITDEIDPKYSQLKIVQGSKSLKKVVTPNKLSIINSQNTYYGHQSSSKKHPTHSSQSLINTKLSKSNGNQANIQTRSSIEFRQSGLNIILDSNRSPMSNGMSNKINLLRSPTQEIMKDTINSGNQSRIKPKDQTLWSVVKSSQDSIMFMVEPDQDAQQQCNQKKRKNVFKTSNQNKN
ncbi:UNKNOWN [Stylonychia lemnae]|uniref:Uncharacterized protein n=1 Tax=Stylonychia lemnae TaxID=5949 RepID=A0A078A855_STYLE|nr:UNKNOWN [Stylonychia lemnae]|eukprot:CDW78440.1 UNKNOWN [Stylonychia lemnae]